MPAIQILQAPSAQMAQVRRICDQLFHDVERVVELPISPHCSKYVVIFEAVSFCLQTFLDKLENGTCQGITYAAGKSWQVRLAPFTYSTPRKYLEQCNTHRIHDLSIQIEFTTLKFIPYEDAVPIYVDTKYPMSVSSSAHCVNADEFTMTEIVEVLDSHPHVCLMSSS